MKFDNSKELKKLLIQLLSKTDYTYDLLQDEVHELFTEASCPEEVADARKEAGELQRLSELQQAINVILTYIENNPE